MQSDLSVWVYTICRSFTIYTPHQVHWLKTKRFLDVKGKYINQISNDMVRKYSFKHLKASIKSDCTLTILHIDVPK